MKTKHLFLLVSLVASPFFTCGQAQQLVTRNDTVNKTVVFGNSKIIITVDYNKKCNISCLEVNGQKVVEGESGIFNQIKLSDKTLSTLHLNSSPQVETGDHTVKISGISYGNTNLSVDEKKFRVIKSNPDGTLSFSIPVNQKFEKVTLTQK